jgi:integrase
VRFLKPAEATRLLNACQPDFRQLVKGALHTGARYAELAGATVAQYSPDARSVHIRPGKSGKGRHIPLTAEGAAHFSACCVGKHGSDLIFTRADGVAWGKNFQVRPLKDACSAARITPAVTFHELRHTYASMLAQAGADLLTISKLLGHADTRITSRHYAHLCDKTLANAVNRFLPNFGGEPEGNVEPIRRDAA